MQSALSVGRWVVEWKCGGRRYKVVFENEVELREGLHGKPGGAEVYLKVWNEFTGVDGMPVLSALPALWAVVCSASASADDVVSEVGLVEVAERSGA